MPLTILQLISWEVDLVGVDLVGVDLLGIDLVGVNFVRVDLVGLTPIFLGKIVRRCRISGGAK